MLRRKDYRFPAPSPKVNPASPHSQGLTFAVQYQGSGRCVEVLRSGGGTAGGSAAGSPWGAARQYGSGVDVVGDTAAYGQVSNSFSIVMLVRVTNTSATNTYALERGGPFSQFAIIYGYTSHTFEFYAGTAFTGSDPRTGSGISVNDNNWHQIAYVYDGATWSGYLDGQQVFSTARTFALTEPTNESWYIGGSDAGNNFAGAIAFVGVWLKPLAPGQVSDLWIRPASIWQYPQTPFEFIGQTLSGASIPSKAAWGNPVITGGQAGVIVPTAPALGPHRNFINPVVAGPLVPAALTGPRAIGAPTLTRGQTVYIYEPSPFVPYTITGPRSIPSPVVAHVQVIHLAGAIPSLQSWPTPVVEGSPQYVRVLNLLGGTRFIPGPSVDGGLQATRIYLSGVEVSASGAGLSYVDNTCQVQSQTIGRWQATFDLEQPHGVAGWAPALGQTVLIVDHGYRLFAGCLTQVVIDRHLMTANTVTYHCTAADKSSICDHRVVTGKTYTADQDAVFVIQDIVSNYLNGEGVTVDPDLVYGSLGALGSDLTLNFPTVTNALDQVANLTGTVWWIDAFSVLHFSAFDDLPAAPFSLSETSLNWRNAQGKYGLTVTLTTTDYYNKLYAVSNLNILPGSGSSGSTGGGAAQTETFDWHPGNPGIQSHTDGSGNLVADSIITSTAIGSVQSLTVNGVSQTVVDFGAYAGQQPSGSDLLWFFAGPATENPSQFVSPTVLPSDHAAIVITYTPAVSTSSSLAQYGSALSPLNPHGDPLGTCGSGVYEGVVQVQNISSQDDLNAIALAQLNRIGGVPTIVDFETDFPGLAPGQKLHCDIPLSGISDMDLLITQVTGVFIPPTLANGGAFRWQVEARSNLDPGNWIKWYERLVGRTVNPLPVPQFEVATWALGVGGNVSAGVQTNPYIVSRTGKLVDISIAADDPPVDQDLLIFIEDGGSPVAQIRLPAGTAANTLVTASLQGSYQQYVFSQDVLTIDSEYEIVGPNPAKASNVTVQLRWTM